MLPYPRRCRAGHKGSRALWGRIWPSPGSRRWPGSSVPAGLPCASLPPARCGGDGRCLPPWWPRRGRRSPNTARGAAGPAGGRGALSSVSTAEPHRAPGAAERACNWAELIMMDNSIIPLFLMHRSVARRPEVTLPDPPSETVTQRRSRGAVACQAPNAAPAVAVGQPWKGSRAPSPRAHTLSPSHTPRWRDRRDPPVPRPSRAVPGHPACHGPAVGMAPSTVAPILPRQPPPSAAGPVAAVPSRAAAVGSVPLAHAVRRPGRCWLHPALRRAGNWLYCSPGGHKAGTASPTPPLPLRRGAGRFFREISCSAPLPPHVPGPPDPPPRATPLPRGTEPGPRLGVPRPRAAPPRLCAVKWHGAVCAGGWGW